MSQGLVEKKSSFLKKFNRPKAERNKGSVREFIAKLSKGLMLPIAMLPIAGLFLGIGAAIVTAAGTPGTEGYNNALAIFGNFLKIPGDVIFGALPVLFAIAIAIAFTKDSGPAALSALVGFLVFSGLQAALISPVKEAGNIIGYDLLFYVDGALGKFSDGFGLPKSLFGSVLGINQLASSVFGGFIVGFTVAFLYNKFKNIQLPQIIGFFSGVRFIPIITFLTFFPLTLVFLIIWPLFGILFNIIGDALGSNMLGFNSFIFGYVERALVPFGLHHAFYSPLWYSSVGGILDFNDTAIINGSVVIAAGTISSQTGLTWGQVFEAYNALPTGTEATGQVAGDQVIWAALNNIVGKSVVTTSGNQIVQFSDFTTSVYTAAHDKLGLTSAIASGGVNAGQYMQGKYPFMMFGLPAAAIAMVMAAPKENRKMSASIVVSAGLTSFLTGITEPIEFTFLFLAPWLFWGVHALFCALSFGLMNWIGLIFPSLAPHIGMTFSGGAIDWVVYGAIQIPGGSNAWWALVFGVAYAPIYFFLFYFLIKKFNIATPGRGDNAKLFTKSDFINKKKKSEQESTTSSNDIDDDTLMAIKIINAYGGLDNIKNVDACITKLRIQVQDQSIVNDNELTSNLGAMGVARPSKQSVYAIYGAKADFYKNKINEIIEAINNDPSLKEKWFNTDNSIEDKPEPVILVNNTHSESVSINNQDLTQNSIPNPQNTKNNNKHLDMDKNEHINQYRAEDESFIVFAPCDCEVYETSIVPDPTFSQNLIGKGVAIKPLSNEFDSILSDGIMEVVFETGHAYSFKTAAGTQILMHIGIDTVSMIDDKHNKIKAFSPKVRVGEKIDIHTKITNIDLEKIKKYAKSDITPIIVLNETLKNRQIKILAHKKAYKGMPLFQVL